MGLRECGSEVKFWLEACGSNWETDSPWILARWVWGNVDRRSGFGWRCVDRRCVDRKCVDWTEKLTHRGSDRDWEMERKLTVGLRFALVGLWVELWGVCVECAVRSALLWESSERVVWGVEMVWSENMDGNDFTGVLGYFTVKGEKHFNWMNLLVQPNTQVLRKSISGSNLKPKQTQPKWWA